MRTSYKIALSILAILSCATLHTNAEAAVAHRHAAHPRVGRRHAQVVSTGFLTAGTASDPDIASASSKATLADATHDRSSRTVTRQSQVGTASFYHDGLVGHRTASGDTYSNLALTAAHRTLDLGTRVRVTNLENKRSVVVTVNDRGPYVRGRIIDLSRRAALMLGFVNEGVTRVRIDPLGKRGIRQA